MQRTENCMTPPCVSTSSEFRDWTSRITVSMSFFWYPVSVDVGFFIHWLVSVFFVIRWRWRASCVRWRWRWYWSNTLFFSWAVMDPQLVNTLSQNLLRNLHNDTSDTGNLAELLTTNALQNSSACFDSTTINARVTYFEGGVFWVIESWGQSVLVIDRHVAVLVFVSLAIHVPPDAIPKHARTFGSAIPSNPCTEPVRYQNTTVPSVLRYLAIHVPDFYDIQ